MTTTNTATNTATESFEVFEIKLAAKSASEEQGFIAMFISLFAWVGTFVQGTVWLGEGRTGDAAGSFAATVVLIAATFGFVVWNMRRHDRNAANAVAALNG